MNMFVLYNAPENVTPIFALASVEWSSISYIPSTQFLIFIFLHYDKQIKEWSRRGKNTILPFVFPIDLNSRGREGNPVM